MTLTDLLQGAKAEYALNVFGAAEIAAVEAALLEKGGKLYVRCAVRKKEIQAKPEELIRQLWLHRLHLVYGYPFQRMSVEYPVTFGRDTSKRADIVVHDADRPTVPYLMVEVKQTKAKDGKEQLRSYAHATGAPLALWSNGTQALIWHRKNPNYFVEIPDLPGASQTIEEIVDQPWTIATLIEKEQQREAEGLLSCDKFSAFTSS